MNRRLLVVLGVLLLAVQVGAEELPDLKTDYEKVNYAIGVYLINNLKQQGIDIDLGLVQKGMKDAHAGGNLLLNDVELSKSIREYQIAVRQKQGSAAKSAAAVANKKAGDAFLEENKKKDGVNTLPSGLQYKVLKVGGGRTATDTDTVEYHFRGTLLNGKEFASSYGTGTPALFTAKGDVIPGVAEALRKMPVGSTWMVYVPPQLGYGEKGDGGTIGPNTTLIYEVELLAIK